MAVERVDRLINHSGKAAAAPLTHRRGRRPWLPLSRRVIRLPLMGLVLSMAMGCSGNKTQTISESYVQSAVNLNNGLVLSVNDVSRLTSATSALQQADSLIRQAVKRRNEALKNFAKTNADFDASSEQLSALAMTTQSANAADVETLIGLVTTFQSALSAEELAALYPERAEFATQTLMLLDEY